MNIKSNDLVLEIGPGTCPYWRSDVLADKYEDDEKVDRSQFGGGPQVTDDKPFVLLDGPYLPFANLQFDYLICSQVLEHVPANDLSILVQEFSRVARKVYIEVPRPAFDIVYDFDVHINFIDIVDNRIVYIPKQSTSIDQIRTMTDYCRSLRARNDFAIEKVELSNISTGQEFSGSIPIFRAQDEQEFFDLSVRSPFRATTPGWSWRLGNLFQRRLNRFTAGSRKARYLLSKA
jgi:hypothetical protein